MTAPEAIDPPRKRGHSRAHDLVSSLTQQILLGTFKPGDKLPSENTLVREHAVSRTVVREALSKLQASGLVEPRHGIGTFVIERQAQSGLRVGAGKSGPQREPVAIGRRHQPHAWVEPVRHPVEGGE